MYRKCRLFTAPKGYPRSGRAAFSLVELVMVVIIIGMLSSVAVPRAAQAARNSRVNALQETIANVRTAVDLYYAEHLRYPGYNPSTGLPDDQKFVEQLLLYTDEQGNTRTTPGTPYVYGPYLRAPFPRNPHNKLATVKVKATPATPDPPAGSVGWVAVLSHGYFGIHASDEDLNDLGAEGPNIKQFLRGVGLTVE